MKSSPALHYFPIKSGFILNRNSFMLSSWCKRNILLNKKGIIRQTPQWNIQSEAIVIVTSLSHLLGDILLNVNGVDLTGVTRSEAVANLKNTSSPVVLQVMEMTLPNESSLDCMPPLHSPCALSPSPSGDIKLPLPNDDYSPLWVSWLQLPR